jgi:hypothetical protein
VRHVRQVDGAAAHGRHVAERAERLEVPLHARQVEAAAEDLAGLVGHGLKAKALEELVLEVLVDVDVRVAQQRGEIVAGRTHAGILEVDPEEPSLVEHQVAAVVVPVAQDAGPGCDLLRQPVKGLREGRTVFDSEVARPVPLQKVLLEVVQLPRELLEVERGPEALGILRAPRRFTLHAGDPVDRLLVHRGRIARRART